MFARRRSLHAKVQMVNVYLWVGFVIKIQIVQMAQTNRIAVSISMNIVFFPLKVNTNKMHIFMRICILFLAFFTESFYFHLIFWHTKFEWMHKLYYAFRLLGIIHYVEESISTLFFCVAIFGIKFQFFIYLLNHLCQIKHVVPMNSLAAMGDAFSPVGNVIMTMIAAITVTN